MLAAAKAVLAPRGTVRAAINMSNILLVTNRADPAQPGGVAPDMAAALADMVAVGQDDRPAAGGDVDMADEGTAVP